MGGRAATRPRRRPGLLGAQAALSWVRGHWAEIDPKVVPASFTRRPDGRVDVEVDQTVRDRAGELLGEGRVRHVYALRDGLVLRMDVEAH